MVGTMRIGELDRKTSETDIKLKLILDSTDKSTIDSGVPFFDHMMNSLSKHGLMKIDLICKGDVEIDDHHSVEDIGIVFGKAFNVALGDKKGIYRFGEVLIPMDDVLVQIAVDLSGRPYFVYKGDELKGYISNYSEELTMEFLYAFAVNAQINLHVNVLYGSNRHHIHEAIFKGLGIALGRAFAFDPRRGDQIPSTKGTI